MPTAVYCPHCNSGFNAPDHLLGQQVPCPSCQAPFVVAPPSPSPLDDPLGAPLQSASEGRLQQPKRSTKKKSKKTAKRGPSNKSPSQGSGLVTRLIVLGVVGVLLMGGAVGTQAWLNSQRADEQQRRSDFYSADSSSEVEAGPASLAEGALIRGETNIKKLLLKIEDCQDVDAYMAEAAQICDLARDVKEFWVEANALDSEYVAKREPGLTELSERLNTEWERALPFLAGGMVEVRVGLRKGHSGVVIDAPRRPPVGFTYRGVPINKGYKTSTSPVKIKL